LLLKITDKTFNRFIPPNKVQVSDSGISLACLRTDFPANYLAGFINDQSVKIICHREGMPAIKPDGRKPSTSV
jgi:hypothetical protein